MDKRNWKEANHREKAAEEIQALNESASPVQVPSHLCPCPHQVDTHKLVRMVQERNGAIAMRFTRSSPGLEYGQARKMNGRIFGVCTRPYAD
jgi:hypothetical protein